MNNTLVTVTVTVTVTVGATFALCYALMVPADRRRPGRPGQRVHSTSDIGGYCDGSGSEGSSFSNWFSPTEAADSSGNPVANGGWNGSDGVAGDSGGDSGGGDGGGGGGGD